MLLNVMSYHVRSCQIMSHQKMNIAVNIRRHANREKEILGLGQWCSALRWHLHEKQT